MKTTKNARRRTGVAFALATALAIVLPAFSASAQTSVNFEGSTFVYQGMVGVARVPSNAKDQYGETLGGWGSAMAIVPGSWKKNANGSYTGELVGVPDRGWNTQGTLDYQGRIQHFNAVLKPFYGAQTQKQDQLVLNYKKLTALHNAGNPTTGLDATSTLKAHNGLPELPIGRDTNHVAVDNEGIVFPGDGTFYISDEYGPYVYHYAQGGRLLNVIRPPDAFIPKRKDANGNLVDNFSANSPPIGETYNTGNPVSGRQNNQGFEGLAISPDEKTLFVLLQSALIQDLDATSSTTIKHTRRNTRLLAYDISGATPTLIHEYAVQLPQYQDQTTSTPSLLVAAQSELHALNNHQFLVLARDSSVGEIFPATPGSTYRSLDLIDTNGATDIVGTSVDAVGGSIAPKGVLSPSITPVAYQKFLDINDNSQLHRFGLHNGAPADSNDLYEKWESIAIEPVGDSTAPNDYFIFVGSDNDFVTQDGFMLSAGPYADSSGANADTLVMVYRATLPTYVPPASN